MYPVDRQLRANQVAVHIFDLALSEGMQAHMPLYMEQRAATFAAQVTICAAISIPTPWQAKLRRSEPNHRWVSQRHRDLPQLAAPMGQVRPDRGAEVVVDVPQVRRNPPGVEVRTGERGGPTHGAIRVEVGAVH